ncbi:hypothetical protein [Ralstonia insidiosa]|uniref:hypothetical protein n=1 Tax=Ralstonia insidiosa TaxID=190721 RepID=UPI000CEED3EA|nr:hypothetical protein [Ralstonia insidiosa]
MTTTLPEPVSAAPQLPVRAGFFDLEGFELLQRVAKAFASSTLVPQQFQGNMANCMIALNLAERLKADALMVMQNLYIVHGRPGWSAKFLIATFNHCGRFTAVKYEFFGDPGTDSWGCRASSVELSSGERIVGPDITIKMAKEEGWYNKTGSKWKTIPQLMLMYRSAGWLINTAAPEISMGLPTQEELHDIIDVRPDGTVSFGGVEEGSSRAPAAVEVPQPQSKSERAAAAIEASHPNTLQQELPQGGETKAVPTPAPAARAARRNAQPTPAPAPASREPGSDDEFEQVAGERVSDSVIRILKTKMEQAALGEADMRKHFGFGYDGVTTANYNDVVAWIEDPVGA